MFCEKEKQRYRSKATENPFGSDGHPCSRSVMASLIHGISLGANARSVFTLYLSCQGCQGVVLTRTFTLRASSATAENRSGAAYS